MLVCLKCIKVISLKLVPNYKYVIFTVTKMSKKVCS